MACPPSVGRGTYQPRAAERSVLHTIVREHLESFLSGTASHADGAGVPRFVEQESGPSPGLPTFAPLGPRSSHIAFPLRLVGGRPWTLPPPSNLEFRGLYEA